MLKHILTITIGLFLSVSAANASSDTQHPKQMVWPFDGFTGSVDRPAAQRGYQVYKEVCAACHAMDLVSFRNLGNIGFSEGEIKTIAAEYDVVDGPNNDGEMYDRPGRASDRFPAPYANEQASRASNNGAYPLDLSLIIKARPDGANYVYSLLTGYQNAPADFKIGDGMHYNKYFPNHQIAMPSPLSDDLVTYQDGTSATTDQMARDIVNFLQWAAEPEMEDRKRIGIKVMLYLLAFTLLFYFAKRRIWARLDS
jgi:ubiquinol-cytochrome c reductase cytochrome c1 subunit